MKTQTALFLCALLSSQLLWAGSFGSKGDSGYDGRSGSSGADGDSVTLFAQQLQRMASYNLSGENGQNGDPGGDGGDARFCSQYYGAENLFGADAGDGGNGGRGGSGGDGGNAVIYYSDISQLKNVMIYSRGGEGGRGAYGGRGGSFGCRCDRYSWQLPPRCWDEKDKDGKVCHRCEPGPMFTCMNGNSGRNGMSGSDGSDGSRGHVTLIKSNTALLSENSGASVSVNKLVPFQAMTAVLTENIFTSKSGANSLLAAGSYVADRFDEFVRRASESVAILWTSSRNPAEFDGRIGSRISDGNVSFGVDSDDVLIYNEAHEAGQHRLTVTEAYKLAEFSRIGITRSGLGKNTKIAVQAVSPRPDLVRDSYYVRITHVRFILRDKVVFEGNVPKDLVQRSNAQTILNIGRIQFEDSDKIWNKKLIIEFTFNRTISGGTQNISKSAKYTQDKL